jgi:hypothetical protein
MERFVREVQDSRVMKSLEAAIRGKGAFRRFKDTLIRLDMEEKWFAYKQNTLVEIAREWCADNEITYRE